jgi:tetratricopeptide (TPR) repeat protein
MYEDLNEAIEALREAVILSSNNEVTAEVLYTLGSTLAERFDSLMEREDLIQSVNAFQKGLSLLPDDDKHRPLFVNQIAKVMATSLRTPELLSVFTTIKSAVVDGAGSLSKHTRVEVLSSLGGMLLEQFQRLGGKQLLEECVHLLQLATELDSMNAIVMTRYGVSRLIRFEHLGISDDLYTAVATQKKAAELVDDPGILNNLGNALQLSFEHSGKVADIDEAVNTHVRALYHPKVCLL